MRLAGRTRDEHVRSSTATDCRAVLAVASTPASTRTDTAALPQRQLGRTGQSVPILGLGTGPGGMGMADQDAIDLYHRAIDLGVTYIDTAPGYGRAHQQVGQVMASRRDEVFLASKVPTDTAEDMLKGLEQGLADLHTDCVDLAYIHHLGNRDLDVVLSEAGSLAGLREARRRGWTRFIGFNSLCFPDLLSFCSHICILKPQTLYISRQGFNLFHTEKCKCRHNRVATRITGVDKMGHLPVIGMLPTFLGKVLFLVLAIFLDPKALENPFHGGYREEHCR